MKGLTFVEVLAVVVIGGIIIVLVLFALDCGTPTGCTSSPVPADHAKCATGVVCTNVGTVCEKKWFGKDCTCQTRINRQHCTVVCAK
jgi:hypothetical protein